MGIRKIVKLQNIGRFTDLSAQGRQFKKLTLIYGENGFGKTTLAGVLRSLSTADAAYIQERKTLGASDEPYAEILMDSGRARFSSGAWDQPAPNLEIFDSTFVSDNVYTGEHVGPEHRKNLYQVFVGAAAVALAREIDKADAASRDASRSANEIEARLRKPIQAPFTVDEFMDLEPETALEEKIRALTTGLSAVRKQLEVVARAQLETLAVPEPPSKLLDVLAVSVQGISTAAERRVREHMRNAMDHRGEAWLRQGVDYLGDGSTCPFCAQDVGNVDLVALFRSYFSDAYKEQIVELERARNSLEHSFGEGALSSLQKRALEIDGRIQGWADLTDLSFARAPTDRLEKAWQHLAALLREALKRKLANPAEALVDSPELIAAIRDYEDAAAAIAANNKNIASANSSIAELKKRAAGTNPETIEAQLRRLRNMQIRQTTEGGTLVEELKSARQRKATAESTKRSKRAELEAISKTVLESYETSINKHLRAFGAHFTITGTKPSFAGGKASSTYRIAIGNMPVDLGDAGTPRGTPCFRTALSTGDKSTLALAFFLAKLEHDGDLGQKCVIVDDPLSSLDCFRTTCTQQSLLRIAETAAQMIVLSHDAFFLKRVHDAADRANTLSFQVARARDTYVLREWDLPQYFLMEAHQEYFQLRSYISDGPPENGDLRGVAGAIRVYLEGHLRHRFPGEFAANDSAGEMVGKIRNAAAPSPLVAMQPKLSELDDLNEYSRPFHHAQPLAPSPTDTELRPWVERALAFVHGS